MLWRTRRLTPSPTSSTSPQQLARTATQVAPEGKWRLDLAVYDDSGALRLIIESKFGAPLLSGQASGYIDYLDDDQPAVLLFVAPAARHIALWSKINQQFGETEDKCLGCVREGSGLRIRMPP